MDVFAQYATDDNAENDGVWVPHGDVELLIARSGNRAYGKELTKQVDQNKVLLDAKDEAADALSEKIMVGVLASTVLKGWRGNFIYKGRPLEYSRENAEMVLTHKDFRRVVTNFADDLGIFKAKMIEEQEKN